MWVILAVVGSGAVERSRWVAVGGVAHGVVAVVAGGCGLHGLGHGDGRSADGCVRHGVVILGLAIDLLLVLVHPEEALLVLELGLEARVLLADVLELGLGVAAGLLELEDDAL